MSKMCTNSYKSYKNPVKPKKFKYLSNKNLICEIIFLVSIIVRKYLITMFTSGENCRSLRKLLEEVVVGQKLSNSHLLRTTSYVRLLAEQAEAGHRYQHCLDVYTPQVHEEDHLESSNT